MTRKTFRTAASALAVTGSLIANMGANAQTPKAPEKAPLAADAPPIPRNLAEIQVATCDFLGETREKFCARLQKRYGAAFTPVIIDLTQRIATHYKQRPSDLLAFLLIESRGELSSKSTLSSAFGPGHYLVSTFCKTLTENNALVEKLYAHFPYARENVDKAVALAKAFLAEDKQDTTQGREAFRSTMLSEDFLPITVAAQLIHIATRYTPEQFQSGEAYQRHFFGDPHYEYFKNLGAPPALSDSPWNPSAQQHQIELLRAINFRIMRANAKARRENVGKKIRFQHAYKAILLPPSIDYRHLGDDPFFTELADIALSTEHHKYFPSLNPRFRLESLSNVSIYFKTQTIPNTVIKTVPVKGKKGQTATVKTTTFNRYLIPRSTTEMMSEIQRRWHQGHRDAAGLDTLPMPPITPMIVVGGRAYAIPLDFP